jgi:hypothetical protein
MCVDTALDGLHTCHQYTPALSDDAERLCAVSTVFILYISVAVLLNMATNTVLRCAMQCGAQPVRWHDIDGVPQTCSIHMYTA